MATAAFSNITISRPKPLWVNLGLPDLLHPSSARQKKGRKKEAEKEKEGKAIHALPRALPGPGLPLDLHLAHPSHRALWDLIL